MKPKVLFVIPYLHCGGAERVVANITNNLKDKYSIDILVNSTKEVEYNYGGDLISLGIDNLKKVDSPLFQFYVLIKRTYKLRRLKKRGNYLVCISNLDSAHISNVISGNKYCKTVLVAHSAMSEHSNNWKYHFFIVPAVKKLYNKANKIVAVSRGVKNDFVANYGIEKERIDVIYNGINSTEIELLKNEPIDDEVLNFISGNRVICNVGRLDYPKAQWHLIRAFKDITAKYKDVVLLIVGDGEYKDYLAKLIRELDLNDKVKLVGFKSNPYSYIYKSDVFAFPSMFEGFPNAPIEALQLGKPIVATDFNFGSREILAPELDVNGEKQLTIYKTCFGYITPVCDGKCYSAGDVLTVGEAILCDALLKVMLELDHGAYGQKYILDAKDRAHMFSLQNMIDNWEKLINCYKTI